MQVAETGPERGHSDGAAVQLFSLMDQMCARGFIYGLALAKGPLCTYSNLRCIDWFEACKYLHFDASLSMALIRLHLKSGDVQRAEAHVTEAISCVLNSCHIPHERVSQMHHIMGLVEAHEGKYSEALNCMENATLAMQMAGLAIDPDLEQEIKKHQTHVAKHGCRPSGASLSPHAQCIVLY